MNHKAIIGWLIFISLLQFGADVSAQGARKGKSRPYSHHEINEILIYREKRWVHAQEQAHDKKIKDAWESAEKTHKELISATRQEATNWIESVDEDVLRAHLSRLTFRGAIVRRIEDEDLKRSRKQYLNQVLLAVDANNARLMVEILPEDMREIGFFRQNLERQGKKAPEETHLLINEWRNSRRDDAISIKMEYPHSFGQPSKEMRLLQDADFSRYRTISEHDQVYRRLAFERYIREHPVLSKINLKNWHFRAETIDDFWRATKLLDHQLPGNDPDLVYFLDSVLMHDAIDVLKSAWGELRRPARPLEHEDMDLFLSEFSGRVVILVGHIENNRFVMQRAGGLLPLSLDLLQLQSRAQQLGVTLVPIGCNSANAGAYFGFTRPIRVSEVAEIIKAIPNGTMTVAELIAALSKGAPVTIDAKRAVDYFEVTIKEENDNYKPTDAVTVIRIPVQHLGWNAKLQDQYDFEHYYATWEEKHRPYLDRGPARLWRETFRESPFYLVVLGSMLFMLVPYWKMWREHVVPRKKLIGRTEFVFNRMTNYVAMFVIGAGVIGLTIKHIDFIVTIARGIGMIGIGIAIIFLAGALIALVGMLTGAEEPT